MPSTPATAASRHNGEIGLALSDDPWVAVTLGAGAAAFGAFIALATALPICCDR